MPSTTLPTYSSDCRSFDCCILIIDLVHCGPMLSPVHISDISETRLKEAEVLHSAGLYDGAFYLAGYSVELALKAKICEKLDIPNLFDSSFATNGSQEIQRIFKIHKLGELMLLSGNRRKFDQDKSGNSDLLNSWSLITEQWSEKCRYMCCNTKGNTDAQNLINAVKTILTWILSN